jgi:hypothetical protein
MNYFFNIKDILSSLPKEFIWKQLFITFLLLSLESFYFLYYTFISKYFSEIISFLNFSFNLDFDGVTYVKFFIIFFVFILLPCKYFIYKKLSILQIRHTYSMKNLFVKNYYNLWVDKYNNNLSFKDLIMLDEQSASKALRSVDCPSQRSAVEDCTPHHFDLAYLPG